MQKLHSLSELNDYLKQKSNNAMQWRIVTDASMLLKDDIICYPISRFYANGSEAPTPGVRSFITNDCHVLSVTDQPAVPADALHRQLLERYRAVTLFKKHALNPEHDFRLICIAPLDNEAYAVTFRIEGAESLWILQLQHPQALTMNTGVWLDDSFMLTPSHYPPVSKAIMGAVRALNSAGI